MHILVAAAMPEEIGVLRRRLRSSTPHDVSVRTAILGETAERAARQLRTLLGRQPAPDGILIVGVAGGLRDDLAAIDLVVPTRIDTQTGTAPGPEHRWLDALPTDLGRRGRLVSVAQIADTAASKRALAEALGPEALAIDLESAALAEVANDHGIPLVVLRAISDTVDESMPGFVRSSLRRDGSMSRVGVVARAVLVPRRWRVLRGLHRRMKRCARVLADAAEVAIASAHVLAAPVSE